MIMAVFTCPCCEQLTLESEGHFEICAVCGWEDDNIQRDDPDYWGGANSMSLNQAKEAFNRGIPVT